MVGLFGVRGFQVRGERYTTNEGPSDPLSCLEIQRYIQMSIVYVLKQVTKGTRRERPAGVPEEASIP